MTDMQVALINESLKNNKISKSKLQELRNNIRPIIAEQINNNDGKLLTAELMLYEKILYRLYGNEKKLLQQFMEENNG